MRVTKRDGRTEEVSFDKVTARIKALCGVDCQSVDYTRIAQRVCTEIYDTVSTSHLDELAANICIGFGTEEPEYNTVASRIIISNHHKNTLPSFADTMARLFNSNLISAELFELSKNPEIETKIDYSRDYLFDYFGFKTLEKGYLKKTPDNTTTERPQHMWMRVALGIHGARLDAAFSTYTAMSTKQFIHATPTLFHAGTNHMQLLSCFLMGMEDSISGIFKCVADCAAISKWAGGIGLNVSNIRSRGSAIKTTNGTSSGIVPMLKIFNDTAAYVNQGGKRNGSFAVYIEPWHADIMDFLNLKKNHGDEAARCRDLFYALWVPDLFMERVEADGIWSLMDPDECPGLNTTHGAEFRALYEKYEADGLFKAQMAARKLFDKVIETQIETGSPYIGYKDAANAKSNQKNLGTIMNSNLCHEIIEYSDSKEYACCTLGSLGLPSFLTADNEFNFVALSGAVKMLVRNLNIIIDKNYYPVPETRRSNLRHRPIGVGVQGLADVYMRLRMPFDSDQAAALNREIFAAIYYAALEESVKLAQEQDDSCPDHWNEWDLEARERRLQSFPNYFGAYSTFEGSPISQGLLQFDLWGIKPLEGAGHGHNSVRFDWAALKSAIGQHGVRNSLLVAPMPTASTSQILGNTECFEPITSNLYARRTLAGDYIIVNNYLVSDLKRLGLWSAKMKDAIISARGSIQKIDVIPKNIRDLYKTSWDLSMKVLINQAADRGAYICQTQSMNLFVAKPEFAKIRGIHIYAWKRGLKTGLYYLRTMPAAHADQVTISSGLQLGQSGQSCLACTS